ncbi:MAG: DUF4349 domain-containing protein [Acidimicrobiia bacterium]
MRKIWMGLSVLALAALACSPATRGGLSGEAPAATTVPAAALAEGEATEARSLDEQVPFPAGVRVIRDARLELRVEEGSFEKQWEHLRTIAADLGGYLSDANVGVEERGEDRYALGTATLRIPADRFEDALARFGALGERISLNVTSQDVSEEYVDLEARLRHWTAMEAFHLELLDRAATVEEALKVQAQLQQIQLTIEQLEGRIRYLDSRTTFATISVFITEVPGPVVVEALSEQSELAQAFDQAGRVLMATFGFLIVAAAAVFPLALLGGVAYLLWRLGRRLAPRPGA